jgi:hypothetical protein
MTRGSYSSRGASLVNSSVLPCDSVNVIARAPKADASAIFAVISTSSEAPTRLTRTVRCQRGDNWLATPPPGSPPSLLVAVGGETDRILKDGGMDRGERGARHVHQQDGPNESP